MKVSTQNLHISLGGTEILKGIDFHTKANSFIGIIGPNGSGKSTLLKCIYRTLKPTSGAVLLDDVSLQTLSLKQSAKKIAVVAQHNHYNFDFTVREVVLMGRAPHKKTLERDNAKDYQIVDEALKTVQMEAFADRTFSTLSGGEQQRVAIARALTSGSELILADEPTGNLDSENSRNIVGILQGLAHEGNRCVIIVTHDPAVAEVADVLLKMKDGKLIH